MYKLINPKTGEAVCRDVFKSLSAAKKASAHLAALGINHVIKSV